MSDADVDADVDVDVDADAVPLLSRCFLLAGDVRDGER